MKMVILHLQRNFNFFVGRGNDLIRRLHLTEKGFSWEHSHAVKNLII